MNDTTSISEIMTKNPLAISPNASLLNALQVMNRRRIGSLAVTGNGKRSGKVIGIITRSDLKGYSRNELSYTKVKDGMSKNPTLVKGSTPISEVQTFMKRHRFGSALIGKSGRLEGIVTRSDFRKQRAFRREESEHVSHRVSSRQPINWGRYIPLFIALAIVAVFAAIVFTYGMKAVTDFITEVIILVVFVAFLILIAKAQPKRRMTVVVVND